jgi:hypothetical protein
MSEINQEQLRKILAEAGISIAGSELDTGNELSYRNDPERIIVVYFDEPDSPDELSKTLAQILSVESCWILFPREGSGSVSVYEQQETPDLIKRLIAHLPKMQHVGEDLYLIGKSGKVFISFDHHLPEEGLGIFLSDVEMAGALLSVLNEIGAELELFAKKD